MIFQLRGILLQHKDDPLTAHLFDAKDNHWRLLRHKLNSALTSGKLKRMFPILDKIGTRWRTSRTI